MTATDSKRESSLDSRMLSNQKMSAMLLLTALVIAALPTSCEAFASGRTLSRRTNDQNFLRLSYNTLPASSMPPTSATSSLHMVHHIRDADMMEMMVGGQRFEMVPLPDSMLDTTIFVGNVCEFAHDEDLSQVFQAVSHLNSVPACVVRRANMASLEYAFVSFPTVEEKEAAIMRFHGREFMGRKLRVEEIRDDPRKGRVRVPEHMVTYVLGSAKQISKKTKHKNNSIAGGMRRVSRTQKQAVPKKKQSVTKKSSVSMTGLPPFPVEKKTGKRQEPSATAMFACLKGPDQEEMDRAVRRGFVSLEGLGHGTTRSKSRLSTAHRQWCDEQEKPQIVHCKATRDNQLDRVIVDLSPLRVAPAFMGAGYEVDEFLVHWKAQIVTAASEAGMELLKRDNLQDSHCERLSSLDEDENYTEDSDCDPDDIECAELFEDCGDFQSTTEYVVELHEEDLHTTKQPISKLPILTMGVFEGDRSKAKAMAKQLALLWNVPQTVEFIEVSSSPSGPGPNASIGRGSRPKRDRKREHKRRRRNVQGDLDLLLR